MADQCLRSWLSRRRLSTPAWSRERRHHAPIRSGFTGRSPTVRIQGPRFCWSRFNHSSASAVVASRVTVLRLAVLVGSSRRVGFVRASGVPWRMMAPLESMDSRSPSRSAHRRAASSERRAPVMAQGGPTRLRARPRSLHRHPGRYGPPGHRRPHGEDLRGPSREAPSGGRGSARQPGSGTRHRRSHHGPDAARPSLAGRHRAYLTVRHAQLARVPLNTERRPGSPEHPDLGTDGHRLTWDNGPTTPQRLTMTDSV